MNQIYLVPHIPYNLMRHMYVNIQPFLKQYMHDNVHEEQKVILLEFLDFLKEIKEGTHQFKDTMKHMPSPMTEDTCFQYSTELLDALKVKGKVKNKESERISSTFLTDECMDRVKQLVGQLEGIQAGDRDSGKMILFIHTWNDIQKDIHHFLFKHMQLLLNVQEEIAAYLKQFKEWEQWMSQSPAKVEAGSYRMQVLFEIWTQHFWGKSKETSVMEIQKMIQTYLHLYEYVQPFVHLYFTLPVSVQTCSICCQHEKNIVCVPCGHTFCRGCVERCRECPLCRAPIQTAQQMFL
jgi:Zinc finger, C3HC4 type (RING finger)